MALGKDDGRYLYGEAETVSSAAQTVETLARAVQVVLPEVAPRQVVEVIAKAYIPPGALSPLLQIGLPDRRFPHDRCNCGLFGRREIGVPAIDDHDDPQLVAAVGGFMFDRIIEHPGFAPPPFTDCLANPEPAFFRNT